MSSRSLKRAKTETNILRKLDEHPNIVKCYDEYEDEDFIYIAMEYIGGGDLFKHIIKQENQTFSEVQARQNARQILKGMQHIHAKGVIHRDIKPENIMLTEDQQFKFIDFGLAAEMKNGGMSSQVGTLCYMAPEIIKGELYSEKVDLWSLGVLIYVFLCGYLPF